MHTFLLSAILNNLCINATVLAEHERHSSFQVLQFFASIVARENPIHHEKIDLCVEAYVEQYIFFKTKIHERAARLAYILITNRYLLLRGAGFD